ATTVGDDYSWQAARIIAVYVQHLHSDRSAKDWSRRLQADSRRLLHCVFANPFSRIASHPAWLTWNDGTVHKLAQTVYDDRRFDLLPILADALEEAGCDNADILAHCRGPGPHVRGCWVVDLLLGKA